jgi:hypothetical protein
LVDELANITTTRDGKEEMQRCEEIFRQICWLEERFWPDVDGMGEEDDSARLGPGLGPIGAMNNGMNGSMNGPMSAPMAGPMSGPMHGPMNGSNMNGPNMNGPNINGPNMNGSNMNGPMNGGSMNGGDGTPVGDGRNSFSLSNGNGLEGVGQNA